MRSTSASSSVPHLKGTLPALNGVRGVAVLMVFLFHARVAGFGGSFIGVDIFFVLSGFLITVLLLQEYQRHGRISLRKFYLRRVLRLFPALLLMLVVYLLFNFFYFSDHASHIHHLQDAFLALFYAANWTRAFDLGRPDVLGHCWSLSLEEQFYAVWPVLLLAILRLRKAWQAPLVALLFVTSWSWRVWLLNQGASWDRVYNGFDTRADMLLAGCLLAFLWNAGKLRCWEKIRFLAPFSALASCIALAVLAVSASWQAAALYQWQYAIVALATGLLILDLLSRPQALLTRLFSWRPLVWLGDLSYGIYLWHYPVLYYFELTGHWDGFAKWQAAGLTMVFSLLSWHLVERPLYKIKNRFGSSGTSSFL